MPITMRAFEVILTTAAADLVAQVYVFAADRDEAAALALARPAMRGRGLQVKDVTAVADMAPAVAMRRAA